MEPGMLSKISSNSQKPYSSEFDPISYLRQEVNSSTYSYQEPEDFVTLVEQKLLGIAEDLKPRTPASVGSEVIDYLEDRFGAKIDIDESYRGMIMKTAQDIWPSDRSINSTI